MPEAKGGVVVAMSGGVDSCAAAALLAAEGYRVTGVTFHLWEDEGLSALASAGSCSLENVEAAERAARALGIEHEVLDLRRRFYLEVVEPFAREYIRGRTPNPCVECNRRIKFPALLDTAERMGADYVATGHYARVRREESGEYSLLRAVGEEKDQSYALYALGQETLGRCLFPNGEMSKEEVREAASSHGVPPAGRRESQEICFLCGGDYRDFLSLRFPEALSPGPILDTSGKRLGEHSGIALFTVGQRRGLGISCSHPLYVVGMDPSQRAVILGSREEVPGTRLEAEEARWIKGRPPAASFEAEAMVRYNSPTVPCRVEAEGDRFLLRFQERVWALTPGQHAVVFEEDRVLGGGVIARSR